MTIAATELRFEETVEVIGQAIDGVGVAIIVVGSLLALGRYLFRVVAGGSDDPYGEVRRNLGRAILLGLELLIAGDIIRTVAISPTLGSVFVLAVIVLIRTFLSATLQVEIEGRWPWQKHAGAPADRGA